VDRCESREDRDPVSGAIPYGRQDISEDDVDAVVRVLRSDFLTQGPVVPLFERAVADYCGVPYAVAVNSATSALHIACLALGLGPGDELWTTPVSFVASANCGLYCGARVDFVDIDPLSMNMSVDALETKLAAAAHQGRRPKVVVPVHLCGQSCDMDRIRALSRVYGFKIIEDASHAVGATYRGAKVGDCAHSDVTVLSFHPVKIITTGEGGMALTRDATLAHSMALLRSHGITRDPAAMTEPSHGAWYYQQVDLGFNYRMTDMQAALGVTQMQRLDPMLMRRRELADRYDRLLADLPVDLPQRLDDRSSAWHLYVARLRPDACAVDRATVFARMREAGIGVNVHYIPIHLQPHYRKMGFGDGDFPHSEAYYDRSITLPMFPALTNAQQDRVVAELARALQP
jgi:UDP-4-amino-4,6-dideoxy-N-acetyl-beta-L-altrosamine transaminase